MKAINVTPAVAVQAGDDWYLGAGLDLMWSDLDFRQFFPWFAITGNPMDGDTRLTFEGDGWGFGAHVGVTWQVADNQRLALTYRSPMKVTYEGDFEMERPIDPARLPPPLRGITATSDFETEINFPSVVGLGYGIRVSEDVRLEANVEWVEHSRYQDLNLDVAQNNMLVGAAMGSTAIPQNWDDTWTATVAGDWRFDPNWTLRAGWTYLPTPVPDDTLNPSLAEGDKNMLAVGLGFKDGPHSLDVAYIAAIADDRTISNNQNPMVNGTYEFESHLIGATYGYWF
jgi:long-chain fatty acid transport protein